MKPLSVSGPIAESEPVVEATKPVAPVRLAAPEGARPTPRLQAVFNDAAGGGEKPLVADVLHVSPPEPRRQTFEIPPKPLATHEPENRADPRRIRSRRNP